MPPHLVLSPSAANRIAHVVRWLSAHGSAKEVLVVAATREAVANVVRLAAKEVGSAFGWHKATLGRLAGQLAAPALAARGLSPVGALSLEALCARMLHALPPESVGRFRAIADRPGLPRALARTMDELRLAGISPDRLPDADLAELLEAYGAELERAGLADRAEVFALATRRARETTERAELVGLPLVLLDVPLHTARERDLLQALAARADDVLVTLPQGDERSLAHANAALEGALVVAPRAADDGTALRRLQSGVFSEIARAGAPGDDVEVLSAPGESRECVEIARRAQREAERGTAFDRMAIVLRAPQEYRTHVAEAMRRGGIPAYFARGTRRPHPAGRAFLALLACAAEGLSARRFAEYLSLGEVSSASSDGAPPPAAPSSDRWVPPDEELAPLPQVPGRDDEADPPGGSLPAPRLWEHILVESAVIGGLSRWRRRLDGYRAELELDLRATTEDAQSSKVRRDLEALAALRAFALPLLEALDGLPREATWGGWIDALSSLATRALRDPERVLAVLAELVPMGSVGPADLAEVRIVLERRLGEVVVPPSARPAGKIFVGSPDEVRGLAFDVVFVPGLAEKIFPRKVVEDPILPDSVRAAIGMGLATNEDRAAAERLALRLAVGAARTRVVVSYPRLDVEQARPRTPSFYALEVLRAAEGKLPGFDELARRAESLAGARAGWPAPARPMDAIDEVEHDLALLDLVLKLPQEQSVGTARYLLAANEHLARALRFRARRWLKVWTSADGLVEPAPGALAALAKHSLAARSFSPTALQQFSVCPYKFVLHTIHKLAPRTDPAPLEELDPLQRGSLVHETLYELLQALRGENALPITQGNVDVAQAKLDVVLERVAARFADELAPAIARVWDDGIASIKADLREMLRRAAGDAWRPAHFELSFGLTDRRERDPASVDDWVALDCGINLRGSIDLVEEREGGALRATDYKTGKAWVKKESVIKGGETLQPVMYALVLEKLFPGRRVDSGRLYYCTSAGDFSDVTIALDDRARESAVIVAKTIGAALTEGFLPAAPAKGTCERCDYRRVCGPYEEQRTARKKADRIAALKVLRDRT